VPHPASGHDDGRTLCYEQWVLSATISLPSPAGPLVDPRSPRSSAICPARIWLIAGAAFAVRAGFCHSVCSIRRDGKSVGQMAREEVSERGGFIAQLAVLAIMTILLP